MLDGENELVPRQRAYLSTYEMLSDVLIPESSSGG